MLTKMKFQIEILQMSVSGDWSKNVKEIET